MLSALIWVPILGAILISCLPANWQPHRYRSVAMAVAGIVLLWTIALGTWFDPTQTQTQFSEYVPWIEWIGLNYHLGLDGLSLPLVFLNSFLTLIAIVSTNRSISRSRFYYALLLLLSSGAAGAFLAQDLLLFFLFYELEIIPLYFLIAIWGGARRGYAAMKFLIYTAVSGILVLASFLGIVWFTGASTFDYEPLRNSELPLELQLVLLIPLLIGLFIKIPIFPFHTWLPDAHVEASTPISVLLAGVLLKLGTYGLLRFGVGLFLDAWVTIAPWLAYLAAISALYGAFTAIAQKDMKKVVAYSSIAHMAYILLAAAATTRLSLEAAVCQMIAHGLISALLFLLVGVVYKKTGSRDVTVLVGLLNPERGLPAIGSMMILGVMASAGIPGMVGFIAEFLVFRGSFPIFPIPTLLCLIGTGLTAVYFLLMVNRVFFGRLSESLSHLPPVEWVDRVPALILSALILILGIQPVWMVRWSEAQAAALIVTPSISLNQGELKESPKSIGKPTTGVSLEQ
ncbi:NADH-quinone oxidoreductase subunit M [Lusitaniella coriacea LEGE 07157]|uniref:NADH-quinone oxidoreductase subunit M n=1 Tax=Lusitaniella coriacea LEGE 07157 TaxID=945747 RepID=A0A8J7DTW1_9CYAN|nr:NADH-quinone oxidoreductase subunit M [Lusitaniella coriacea]MBE9114351.1 NADH-quinone oxidoreductase subunit M [Lusitaniella coriacea LEGE 07157]